MAGHVFISHGSENRDEANALSSFLEARGITTWIAPRDVRPGMDYSEELQAAIEACAAFVVLVTDHSNKSPYVRAETEMAFSISKPIFPVRKSDIKPAAGLALFLKIRHWTDAYGSNHDSAMDRLALELQTVAGVTVPPQPAPPEPTQPPATPVEAIVPPVPAPPPPPIPAPTPPPVDPGPPPTDEEKLRAAIGPHADFYLNRWAQMDQKKSKMSWNWPACLLNPFWFAYRKMWWPMVGFIVIGVVLGAIGGESVQAARIQILLFALVGFVTGTFGNHLYRLQVRKLIDQTAQFDRPNALAQLSARGGISTAALITSLVIFLLAMVGTAANQVREQRQRQQQQQPQQPQAQQAPPQTQIQVQRGQQPDQPAAPAANAGTALDPAFLLGRWTDEGDCNRASQFNADGTFVSVDGNMGSWVANGDQVTFSGDSSITVRIQPIDANSFMLTDANGQSARATRC